MKLKIKNNYILTFCVLALAVVCFMSVNSPIRFQHQQEKRETAVKQQLVKIRIAEEKYRNANDTYTGDFAKLVKAGYISDSLKYIPYSDGMTFTLTASTQMAKSGKQIPVMECSAGYSEYLKGLDENAIANLTQKANDSGRFPGLKIGDITTPNDNAGNWE